MGLGLPGLSPLLPSLRGPVGARGRSAHARCDGDQRQKTRQCFYPRGWPRKPAETLRWRRCPKRGSLGNKAGPQSSTGYPERSRVTPGTTLTQGPSMSTSLPHRRRQCPAAARGADASAGPEGQHPTTYRKEPATIPTVGSTLYRSKQEPWKATSPPNLPKAKPAHSQLPHKPPSATRSTKTAVPLRQLPCGKRTFSRVGYYTGGCPPY